MYGLGPDWDPRDMQSYFEESTNPVKQFIYIFLFISTILAVFSKTDKILSFIKMEKYAAIFVVFCMISLSWSDYSIISLKRSFQLFVMVLVIMVSVIFIDKKKLFQIIQIIISIYIIATIISVFTIPEAIDPKFNTWRGLELQKNGLGQAALICFLFSLIFYSTRDNNHSRIWNYGMTALSILIIFMAQSSTIIIVFFMILLIFALLKFETIFSKLGIRRFLIYSVLLFVLLLTLLLSLYATDLIALITYAFEKDLTFTGRTLFWGYLIDQIQSYPVLGYGYGTFWIMGSEHIYRLFIVESLVMSTSHNGFIDLTLQLGITGLIIFFLMAGAFFNRAIKTHNTVALLALIAILLSNITETTFLGTRNITFTFFYFYFMTSNNYFQSKTREYIDISMK